MADALAKINISNTTSTTLLCDPTASTLDILWADKNGELSHRIARVSTTDEILYNTNTTSYHDVNTSF